MRCSFALAALSALLTASAAVVVQPPNVGPLSPDQNPSTSLTESIRRMKLSLDRELVYLAHMEDISDATDTAGLVARQQADADDYHGFRLSINDGKSTFRPTLPGTYIPSAKITADEPMETPQETDDDQPFLPVVTTAPPLEPTVPTDVPTTDAPSPMPVPPFPSQMPTFAPLPTDPQAPVVSMAPMQPGTEPFITEPLFTAVPFPIVSPDLPIEDTPTPLPTASMPPSPSPVAVDPIGAVLPGADGDDGATTSEPSPNGDDDDDDAVCFPADATVQLEDGSVKTMADVQLGDRVLVHHGTFSPVFMFTHKLSNIRYNFVNIQTSSGNALSLTSGHYLYVNGRLSAASTVRPGDTLMLADSSLTHVTHVSTLASSGLFNPQTLHGDIVVNGLKASTYTTAVEPGLAHALLSPLRAAYSRLGFSLSAFEAGADLIASYMPSGALVN